MKNKAVARVLNIVASVVMYIFFAICLALLIITLTARKNKDGTPIVFGYEIRFVLTNSMEKCEQTNVSNYKIKDLPVHSAVFVEVVPTDPALAREWYSSLKVGDVITFKYVYGEQETITHRIVKIEPKSDGGYILTMEGDNKAAGGNDLRQVIDTSKNDNFNYVIGKVTGKSVVLGFLIYILKQPAGIVCIVIVPCLIIIIVELIRIINLANKKKKKKIEEDTSHKESEIEELKRRLAELEQSNNGKEINNKVTENSNKNLQINFENNENTTGGK